MSSVSDKIREVLKQHHIFTNRTSEYLHCHQCRLVLPNMTEHLVQALAEVLDPFYAPPEPFQPEPTRVSGQRESTIGWED